MFLLYVQVEVQQNNIKIKALTTCFYFTVLLLLNRKLFQKAKRSLELVSLPHFLRFIRRKIILTLCFINWPNFILWLPLLFWNIGSICIVITCCAVCDVINFEINISFLIKPFFLLSKKLWQKCKYLENEKSF